MRWQGAPDASMLRADGAHDTMGMHFNASPCIEMHPQANANLRQMLQLLLVNHDHPQGPIQMHPVCAAPPSAFNAAAHLACCTKAELASMRHILHPNSSCNPTFATVQK
jgi:hypothetical protein